MIKHPVAIIAALAVFIVGTGTTTSVAMWSATATATASVAAGSLGISQTGFTPAAFTYTSSALSTTNVVTLTNTGTVPAPYTLTLGAPATTLASGVDLRVVLVASPAACTTAAVSGSPSQNWTSTAVLTGSAATTLAVGASVYYCVSSTITQAQRFSLVGISAAPTATLASSIGNWVSATTTLSATQTVANTLTPGAPVASNVTDHGMTLTWAAPADTAAIKTYQVFRNGTYIGTTTAPTTTLTDTGLNVATAYSYTVKAFDAGGDASPASTASSLSTSGINPSSWYKVKLAGTDTCIDGEKENQASGTLLIFYGCKPTLFDNQAWQFIQSGSTYSILAKYSLGSANGRLYWDLSDNNSVNADVETLGNSLSQDWYVSAVGNGTFTLKNRSTGRCLDNTGATTPQGDTQVVTRACVSGLASQTFTLTNVG